ncbi:MAG: hypothetical protein R2684_15285 [Pyrinomonadaceae bacterium]
MSLYVSDSDATFRKGIRVTLKNAVNFDIVFLIGSKNYTVKSGQTQQVRATEGDSIEARPMFIGIDSGFIVGGVKTETTLTCLLETDGSEVPVLVLEAEQT